MAGDFIQETDSVATVMGQIVSSFVPLVDIRDVAGNLVHGDYVFAGLSAVGLIPYAGDGAKAGGKVVKFVIKNADNLPMMMNLFEGLLKNCPDLVADLSKNEKFTEMVESLAKADTSKLTKREKEIYEQFLRKAGVSEDVIKGCSKANYLEQLDNLSENKINHIINGSKNSNHGWENLVPDKNWSDIKNIIADVMDTGVEGPYKSVFSKKATINGFEVEVTYTKLSDDTIKFQMHG